MTQAAADDDLKLIRTVAQALADYFHEALNFTCYLQAFEMLMMQRFGPLQRLRVTSETLPEKALARMGWPISEPSP